MGQRNVAAASVVSFGFGSVLLITAFYLPIWYQAIKGTSAVDSGIQLLPYFLITVVFVIGSGVLVSKIGYHTPVLNVGTAIAVVACGLFTTFTVDTSKAEAIGFQVVIGTGLGLALIQSQNAVQTVLSRGDIPVGITTITFSQFLGGTIFVSVCQSILTNTLKSKLSSSIPDLDVQQLSSTGATNLKNLVSEKMLPILLAAYNKGIVNVFYVSPAVALLAFVASLSLERRSVRQPVAVEEDKAEEKGDSGHAEAENV